MDSLFPMNTQSDDFMNCLDFGDENVTDEMWLPEDLLTYQPLLNDCMLSGEKKVPVVLSAKDVMLSACGQTAHEQFLAFIKDQEFDQDIYPLVDPNVAMTLDKERETLTADEPAMTEIVMTEAAFPCGTETEECMVEDSTPVCAVPTMPTSSAQNTHYVLTYRPAKNSILKPQTVAPALQTTIEASERLKQPIPNVQKVQIRLMPQAVTNRTHGPVRSPPESNGMKNLPLSPPNSDSDGSLSPLRSDRPSITQTHFSQNGTPQKPKITTSLLSSSMPSSGLIILSEEEERTLISEGYPVPTKWPLTKQEEKILKKIQRKIKNKVSAQESRRKKKDYIDNLEKRLEASNQENTSLKKKVEKLEHGNRVLMSQIEQLKRAVQSVSAQTSTYVMVFVLFFAVFLGAWSPLASLSFSPGSSSVEIVSQQVGRSFPSGPLPSGQQVAIETSDYKTPNMKSRTLLSVAEDPEDTNDASQSATCFGGVLSWLLHSGPKAKHYEQSDSLPVAPMRVEVKGESSVGRSLENQTQWKASGEQIPAGVDMIYTSDFITVPASES